MKRERVFPLAAVAFLLFCSFGFVLAPHDPNLVDIGQRFLPASPEYPLGTDSLGRCLLSRLLYGGKATLGIVVSGAFCVAILGVLLGLSACRQKGKQSIFAESLLNAITAIPPIAYLIIFIAAWGNGFSTMLAAITLSLLLRLVKLIKSRAEIEIGKAYVMCALTSGAGRVRIRYFHILPNVAKDILNFLCLSSADMILAIVGFSFIGLGLGDNVIDWGTMVADSMDFVLTNPWLMVWPVAFIIASTLSFNILGRALEDQEDSRA